MAITITFLTSVTSGTDASSYVTPAVSPGAGSLLLAFCSNTDDTNPSASPTATGWSLTWNLITTNLYDGATSFNRSRMALFATITAAAPGSNTFTYNPGQVSNGGEVHLLQVTGADVSSTTANAIVQSPIGAALTGTTGTVTLASPASADNRPVVAFVHHAAEGKNPRSLWAELADTTHATPNTGIQTQWRSDAFETTATATWATSIPWGGIAAEIRAASDSGMMGFIPI